MASMTESTHLLGQAILGVGCAALDIVSEVACYSSVVPGGCRYPAPSGCLWDTLNTAADRGYRPRPYTCSGGPSPLGSSSAFAPR